MNLMKNIFLLSQLLLLSCTSFAQKQTFDVVSFALPKGWQQQQGEAGIQLSTTDKKTGAYAIVVITKSIVSNATANENFNNDWLKLVKGAVQVNSEPKMQKPTKENGWDVISGNANYTDGANTGVTTLLTATSDHKAVSIVLMTNTKQYQNELSAFITSLELSPSDLKISTSTSSLSPNATIEQANSSLMAGSASSPIVGKIWEGTSSEKFSGAGAMTGHYTGGFSSSQYQFNADGTYKFIEVLASFYTNTKTYKYETGAYTVSGNQLTIKPTKGQNEEWTKVGKTSNGNSDVSNRAINETWGKKIKTTARKLETYTYTFSIGKNGDRNALILQRSGRTEREGEGKIAYYNETARGNSVKLPVGIN